MSTNDRDTKFEVDSGIRSVWQAADHPEPPAELDSRILAAARHDVTRPQPRKQGWWRLALPFSATAVLVLAVTLLLRVEREAPQLLHDAAPPSLREVPAPIEAGGQAGVPLAKAPPEKRVTGEPGSPVAKAEHDDTMPASGIAASHEGGASKVMEAERLEAPAVAPAPLLQSRQQALPGASREPGKTGLAADVVEAPGETVERIRRLLAEGGREEALRLLAELRRQHPDYPLPQDLRELR